MLFKIQNRIECFIGNVKFENIKDGEGSINDTMADSDENIVYVVYKI